VFSDRRQKSSSSRLHERASVTWISSCFKPTVNQRSGAPPAKRRDVTDAGKATDISSFRERVIGRGRTHMRCCGNIARERHLDRCWDWASEPPA